MLGFLALLWSALLSSTRSSTLLCSSLLCPPCRPGPPLPSELTPTLRIATITEARRQVNLLKRLNVSSHQSLISDIGEIGTQIETQNARLVEELREAAEREEKLKRELDLTKLELDTLSTQVPKLQKRFQKSFRERELEGEAGGGGGGGGGGGDAKGGDGRVNEEERSLCDDKERNDGRVRARPTLWCMQKRRRETAAAPLLFLSRLG